MGTRADIEAALAARDYDRLVGLIAPGEPDPALARTRRFAANMRALRARDPDLAAEVESAPASGRVRIVRASDGRDTLAPAGATGDTNPLCPTGTPTGAEAHADKLLREMPEQVKPIALAGVGDGAVLSRLALEPPSWIGWRRVLYVIEPDAEIFRSAMLLHDWSGEAGPLADGRTQLAVGAHWKDRLHGAISADSQLPPPKQAVRQCADPGPILEQIAAALEGVRTEAAARRQRLMQTYSAVRSPDLARRLRAIEGARVLLLTTRYSTVLQHSTRDYARAVERLGGVARVVIEREPWRQHMIPALLGEVEGFAPDLVIQIDHHRFENPETFPTPVPFVCVIQDNLPNLMSREAARKLGPTDFIAGPWAHRYVLEYGYNAGRCIETPRLTPAPEAPAVHTGGGPDVLYVSNHSQTPGVAVDNAVQTIRDNWPEGARIAEAAGRDLVELYQHGGCVEDELDLARLIAGSCRDHGLTTPPPDRLTALTDTISVCINNPLYRQQGLRWTLRAAERLGLTVALHGKGWGDRDGFRQHDRGPIPYTELPEATARARFCMTLEPYFPTQHQRALDTWMWGGLPLIRRRMRETQQLAFNAWMDRLPAAAACLDDALDALGPDAGAFRAVYDAQLGLHAWDGSGDLVALYRKRERDGIGDLMALPPRYDEISFTDADGLASVMRRLSEDPDLYDAIQREQHGWVRERFCYERGVRRIMQGVADRLGGG